MDEGDAHAVDIDLYAPTITFGECDAGDGGEELNAIGIVPDRKEVARLGKQSASVSVVIVPNAAIAA